MDERLEGPGAELALERAMKGLEIEVVRIFDCLLVRDRIAAAARSD